MSLGEGLWNVKLIPTAKIENPNLLLTFVLGDVEQTWATRQWPIYHLKQITCLLRPSDNDETYIGKGSELCVCSGG